MVLAVAAAFRRVGGRGREVEDVRLDRLRLELDPPFSAAWDPVPRRHFDATVVRALLVPALRVFRVVRFVRVLRLARATRGLRLLRLVSSLNRGMKALNRSMSRRGFGYVVLLTLIVATVGAAVGGAEQYWTRGAAAIPPYSPTGAFPGDYHPAGRPPTEPEPPAGT